MNENTFTLKNVVGLEDVKEALYNRLVLYYKKKSKYEKYGVTPEKGMLLASIPGCGKSMVIKSIRNDYKDNKNFIVKSIDHGFIMRGTVGSSARSVSEFFEELRKRIQEKDVVLLMDEIDDLFPSRGKGGVLAYERTTAFLEQVDGQFDDGKNSIFIVGATNQPFNIDPGVIRNGRLGKLFIIEPPNAEERKLLFRSYMKPLIRDYAPNIGSMKACRIATVNATEGYVGVDFRSIQNELLLLTEKNNGILTAKDIALVVGNVRKIQDKKMKDIETFKRTYTKLSNGYR